MSEATKNFLDNSRLMKEDRVEITLEEEKNGDKLRLELYADHGDGHRRLPSWYASTFPNVFPEKRKLGGRNTYVWELPATLQNADILTYISGKFNGQVKFDDCTELKLQLIFAQSMAKERNAVVISKWKSQGRFPMSSEFLKEHKERPLAGFQKIARHCIINNDGFALFMQQGTGKTPVMISAMCNMAAKKRKQEGKKSLYRVLVICPKNVRYNWEEEMESFATCEYKSSVIRGDKFNRESELLFSLLPDKRESELSVTIASYGSLAKTIEAFALKNIAGKTTIKVKWDLVILDESHYIKTPRAMRTKASFALREASEKRAVLTGTPITNTLLDVWAQLEFLGEGYSGFSTFNAFREFFGVYKLDEMGHKKLVDFDNIPLLQEILAKNSFIITKEEALPNLPEKVYDAVEVSMTASQREAYTKVASQIFIEAESAMNADGSNQQMTVNNILTKMLRLSQITSGFLKFDDEYDDEGNLITPGRIEVFDINPKLESLVELLKEKEPQQKTIIWAHYTQDIKSICTRLRVEGLDVVEYHGGTSDKQREISRERFNKDPKCKIMVGNSGAGGTGLNLLGFDPKNPDDYETYCDHVIYFSQDWSSSKRSQSEDRCHRRGTKCNIRVTDLVVPGTIDQEIRTRVRMKQEKAVEIQDIHAILESLVAMKLFSNGDS